MNAAYKNARLRRLLRIWASIVMSRESRGSLQLLQISGDDCKVLGESKHTYDCQSEVEGNDDSGESDQEWF